MPEAARRSCGLPRVPDSPTQADLEVAYQVRGAALVACDVARRLAVQTHDDEHALADKAEARRRPWWKVWN